jgi:hypothetical protein
MIEQLLRRDGQTLLSPGIMDRKLVGFYEFA